MINDLTENSRTNMFIFLNYLNILHYVEQAITLT